MNYDDKLLHWKLNNESFWELNDPAELLSQFLSLRDVFTTIRSCDYDGFALVLVEMA